MTDRYLLDASAFLRFFSESDSEHATIVQAVNRILREGGTIYYSPQVVRESWSVLTRPATVGGYGRTPEFAASIISKAKNAFSFIDDTPAIYQNWLDLVKTHGVSGRQVHDANHVAAMIAHGITHIITLDSRDFGRYSQITVLRPEDIQ